MKKVNWINKKLFSAEKQKEYLQHFRQRKEPETTDLVLSFGKIVLSEINKQINRTDRSPVANPDDLLQVGMVGVIKGLEEYDESRGTVPTTCVFYWVRKYLSQFISNNLNGVGVSVYAMTTKKERAFSPGVRDALKYGRTGILTMSLESKLEASGDQLFIDHDTPETHLIAKDTKKHMFEQLDKLPELDQNIIRRFYLQEDKVSDIAADLNVSEKWVYFVKQRALKKLKSLMDVG